MGGINGRASIGRVALALVAMAMAAVSVTPAASATEEIAASCSAAPTAPPTTVSIEVNEEKSVFSYTQPFAITGTFSGSAVVGRSESIP